MYRKLARAAIALLALALSLSLLQGCAKKEQVDPRAREYVKEELATLLDLMFCVSRMNPTVWTGIESYYVGDFSNKSELYEYLDKAYEGYKKVGEYFENISYERHDSKVAEELRYLRSYIYLSAEYNKIAIDLLKKDMDQNVNYSKSVISGIGSIFDNIYSSYFFQEYNRIAEKFGLPKRGE